MADKFYRLRIRNAADSADDLVVTSVRGGTNPYALEPPHGDGQSFDPLTGEGMTGAYTFSVIDAALTATNRVLTGVLADANARQQLLSRKAFVETSDDASSWDILVPGYVTAVRLPTAIRAVVQVGQTRRIENTKTVFRNDQSYFNKVTSLVGGPIRGGWGPIRDQGGWRVQVTQINTTYNYVQVKPVSAFDPRRLGNPYIDGRVADHVLRETQELARPYFRKVPNWDGARIRGWFPGLYFRVQNLDGTLKGTFTALADPQENGHPEDLIIRASPSPGFFLDWTPAGSISVGDLFDIYLYPSEVSETNPLHIEEHPVDLVEQLWIETGIAYDDTVLPALKELLGSELRLLLRITAPWNLGTFLKKVVFGPFGLATRVDSQGRQALFSTRIKSSSTPAAVITLADLADKDSTVFDLDESTVANRVTFKTERYSELVNFPAEETASPDATHVTPVTVSVENGDTATVGDKEIVFEIPGTIKNSTSIASIDLDQFVTGIGREIFDRFGRGAIAGELNCLPAVTALLGEEVQLDLPHLPNAVVGQTPVSQRGGIRIVQVVRRTERPSGPSLKVIDSGTSAQASTAPTISIAAGADARKVAVVTITNAAALAAAGLLVRLEIGTGAIQPATGALLTIADPATQTTVTTPSVNAGTRVWVRARSEKAGQRPSAWSAWANVQLTALNAVTGLAVSAEDAADRSRRLLTWTVGANASDIPVEVLLNKAGEAQRLEVTLPPGSTQYELRGLDAASRTATVRHKESAPFAGVSADASIGVVTAGGQRTLSAPTEPTAFAGQLGPDGVLVLRGGYGIEVWAAEVPSGVEVQVAIGAGAFETVGIVPSALDDRTRWRGRAPNDGLLRRLRARHVAAGATESAWTAEVSVYPWGETAPETPLPPGHVVEIDSLIEVGVAHDPATQRKDEENVRARRRGGLDFPEQAYDATPIYDDTGATPLIDTAARRITADLGYVDGTAIEDLKPAEAGAETTTGKSLTVLVDRLASNVTYADSTAVEALKPAQAGADVTSANTSADTSAVAGRAAATVKDEAIAGKAADLDLSALDTAGYVDRTAAQVLDTVNVDGVAAATVAEGAERGIAGLDVVGDVKRGVPRTHAVANVPGIDLSSGKVDKGTVYDTGEAQAGLRDTARLTAQGVSAGSREELVRGRATAGLPFPSALFSVAPIFDSAGENVLLDPALGQISKVLRVPFAEFVPYDSAQSYRFNPGRLTRKPGDAVSNSRFMAPLLLPKGVTVTLVTMRGYRANTNQITRLYLYRNDDSGTATVLAGPLSHSTTGWQSVSSSTLAQLVGDQHYTLEVELDDNTGASGDTQFAWCEVAYTMPDYAKTL